MVRDLRDQIHKRYRKGAEGHDKGFLKERDEDSTQCCESHVTRLSFGHMRLVMRAGPFSAVTSDFIVEVKSWLF